MIFVASTIFARLKMEFRSSLSVGRQRCDDGWVRYCLYHDRDHTRAKMVILKGRTLSITNPLRAMGKASYAALRNLSSRRAPI